MPASLLFLCRGTGGMGMPASPPDCSAMLTPVCPREEFCCRAFWASEGWSVWPTGMLKKSPYQNVKYGLPVMFNSAKFFPNVVKAYSRDYSYCTKFDMVLQRLKQNQCLNNWTVKLFSLFPSQTEPALTNVFKKQSVKKLAHKMSVWKNDDIG